jgi:hypothetical protein
MQRYRPGRPLLEDRRHPARRPGPRRWFDMTQIKRYQKYLQFVNVLVEYP